MKRYVIRRKPVVKNGKSFLYPYMSRKDPYVWVRLKDAQEMADLMNAWSEDYESKVEEV